MQINEAFLSDFFWHITFVLLLVFTIISSLITVFSKEKTFFYYSLYTFFLFTYILLKTPYQELRDFFAIGINPAYNFYSQTLFYSFYFYFFLYFLDIKSFYPKLTRLFKRLLFGGIILSTLVFVLVSVMDKHDFFDYYFIFVYLPFVLSMASVAIVKATKTPGYLKYYFIIGSLIYIAFAMLSLILSFINYNYETQIIILGKAFYLYPILFFYIGVFVEQIMFSLGLSYRVKNINDKLIEQFERNKIINQKLNQNLEKRNTQIQKLTQKAEEERVAQLKSAYDSQINKLQLSLLHNQMNPHFIFNALNSIKVYLIENNKEKAIYYLNKFSKLIRKILDSSRGDVVSLEEELEMIKLYLGIEKIRFDDTINVHFNIPYEVSLSQIKIPPLLLQPFVENAIWHGLSPLNTEKKLVFKIVKVENGIQLKIIDNGVGRETSKQVYNKQKLKRNSLGLKITNERIAFFNKKENLSYQFKIFDLKDDYGNPTGTEVRFLFKES